eukprot:m.359695 g.359695  ORF g.359695 m.359695 type:complete len:175 (-) comp18675_c0_seq1:364-888(-)
MALPPTSSLDTVASRRSFLIGVLVAQLVTFAAMIPGGPLETRSFSTDHSVVVIASFNVLLSTLGIGTLATIAMVTQRFEIPAFTIPTLGLLYVVLLGIDLVGIFPTSLDEMGAGLLTAELLGTVFGVTMIVFGQRTSLGLIPGKKPSPAIVTAWLIVYCILTIMLTYTATIAAM